MHRHSELVERAGGRGYNRRFPPRKWNVFFENRWKNREVSEGIEKIVSLQK